MEIKKKDITDEFLNGYAQDIYRQSSGSRSEVENEWAREMDLYHSNFSKKERDWSTFLGTERLFIPKTYSNVQRILVEVMDTFFFDQDEIVDINSDKDTPYTTKQIVKSLLNYRLNSHPIDAYKEFYEAGLDAIRNKLCVLKVFPKLKTEEVEREIELTDPETGEVEKVQLNEEKIVSYEPCLVTVPIEDVFFSPNSTWKDYWKYPIVHRYRKTRDELKKMKYKNVDNVSAAGTTSHEEIKQIRQDESQSPFTKYEPIQQAEEVYVYEVWCHLPGEDGLESGSFITLGSESGPEVLARGWEVNDLPYKFSDFEYNRPPFVVGVAFPEPHVLYGKSFPKITESLQIETNAIHNQEREAVARALRQTVILSRDSNPDLMSLVNRRIGGYVQVDGPVGQAYAEVQSVNPSAISGAHQARVDQDYFEASGIPPNLLGLSTNEDTATAATQQLSNANKKISMIIKNIAFTAFLPALQMLLRLEQSYVSDEYVQLVTGKTLGWGSAFDNLPPRDLIQGDFDLKVNFGLNKQAQINKFMMIMDRVNQTNQAMAQLLQFGVVDPRKVKFGDPMKVLDATLALLGMKNSEEWKLQALPPQPQGEVKGIASQARATNDPVQEVTNLNPEASGALSVI